MQDIAQDPAQDSPQAGDQQANQEIQTDTPPTEGAEQASEKSAEDILYGKEQESPSQKEEDSGEGDLEKEDESGDKDESDEKDSKDSYDLKLPEGSALKDEQVDKIAAIAKQRGLSNEQAQELLESTDGFVSDLRKDIESEVVEKQKQHIETAKKEWLSSSTNDKEIGGENFKRKTELAHRVVKEFGTPELYEFFNTTGLGKHPEAIRVFTRIGERMEAGQFVNGGRPPKNKPQTYEETLWPKQEQNN